ncbi:MAG: hypothetical protein ACRELD_02145 [Longimicrobiales bacterium]
MTVWHILGGVIALLIGIYAGLGFPGLSGREDRVVSRRRPRRRTFTPLDWLRPPKS